MSIFKSRFEVPMHMLPFAVKWPYHPSQLSCRATGGTWWNMPAGFGHQVGISILKVSINGWKNYLRLPQPSHKAAKIQKAFVDSHEPPKLINHVNQVGEDKEPAWMWLFYEEIDIPNCAQQPQQASPGSDDVGLPDVFQLLPPHGWFWASLRRTGI